MEEQDLKQIPLTALLTVVGVILPQFFHLLGLGAVFLPMFLPVMLGSMLLTWRFALILAVVTPLLSFLITGMPPLTPPVLPIMLSELILISLILSLMHVHGRKSKWLSLVVAILADRVLLFAVAYGIAPYFGLPPAFTSITLVVSGIPGIILQLMVIPAALRIIEQKFPQYIFRNVAND